MKKVVKKTIYSPRKWTRDLHESQARWKVIVCHRRAGKTTSALAHLVRDCMRGYRNNEEKALQEKSSKPAKALRFAFISPSYKQSKRNAWDVLKELTRDIEGVSFNEAELRCDFANGSRITLFGADNPDSLRGMALWGVVFDEYSQQPSNIFSEIIAPALADNKGYAIWIGTPKGKNAFYELYEYALKTDEDDSEKWLGLKLTVDQTNLIDEEELVMQKTLMTEDEYLQEWYCSFEAAIKGAYYAKELSLAREQGRISNVPHDKMLEVYTFWDLGMNDSTSIGFFQVYGKEYRMIDYYENHGQPLSHYANTLKQKAAEYDFNYGRHYLPHDIEVKELGTGISRREVLENLGVKVEVVPALNINDGINAGRIIFDQLWVDKEKCDDFIQAIAQYRQEWDEKRGQFKDRPLHDWSSHAADMFRYFAVTHNKLGARPERQVYVPNKLSYHRR